MTITIGTIANAAAAASGTTQTLAVTAVAGAGLIIFSQSGGGQSITPAISDDKGSTYIQLGSFLNNNSDNSSSTCFYCKSLAGSNPTITQDFTGPGARTNRGLVAIPITGHDATATPVRVAALQSAPGTATDGVTTGNITPGAQPCKLVGFASNSFNQALTAGTGFTDNGGAFASWTTGVSCNTRVESKDYASLTPTPATFTQGGAGTGRTVSQVVAVPDGATYTRRRATVLAMLMAGIFAMSSPAPAPGPSPSPPPAPTTSYGATADAGEVDDPTLAPTWDGVTLYKQGQFVKVGSNYFVAWYDSLNVLTSNTTYWFAITKFYCVNTSTGNDSNTGSTDPAAAIAAPLQTMVKIEDYLNNGGSVNAVDGACILWTRNQTFFGNITGLKTSFHGAIGTGNRPIFKYRNITTNIFTDLVFNMSVRTMVRNLDIVGEYITHVTTTGTVTLVDGDVCSRASDGLFPGTVIGTPTNNRLCLRFTTLTDSIQARSGAQKVVTGDVFQTSGGTRSATCASPNTTVIGCISSGSGSCQIHNCTIREAVGNGVGAGTTGTRNSASDFWVRNCFIFNTCRWGGNGGGCQGGWGANDKLLYLTAYDNGTNVNGAHNFYLDDMDTCEFAYNWAYMTGAWGNHALVVHGRCDGLDIHDNLMELSQSGFGMNDGYPTIALAGWYEEFSNCLFYRNVIRFCGTYNGSGLIIDLAACTGCKFFNNVCYGNKGTIGMQPYKTNGDKARMINCTFAFNTFISDTTVGAGDYFCKVNSSYGVSVTGIIFRNNILESQRTSLPTFSTDSTTLTTDVTFDYNLIYNITGWANVMRWNGVTYSLAGWAGTGSINSNSTNVTTSSYSTVFVDKTTWNLKPGVSSPALLRGTPFTSVTTTDFNGVTRSATAPTVGAFES